MRRNRGSVAANPVLVGAVTVLVVVVAVFLAYNANNGLPFVPTRQLNVQIKNGAQLVKGNEVREGGFRVGVIEEITPSTLPNGTIGANLKLKLDKKEGPLPVDSTAIVRPRSALGLKYVQVIRGRSKKTFGDGATLPSKQATVPVQLEDVFSTFDAKTRSNSRKNLLGFGGALAGRGGDLNTTIQQLPPLFSHLTPVAQNLTDPKTETRGFFRGTERAAGAVAPVSKTQVKLLADLGTTFAAIDDSPSALKATISKSPPTLDVSTRSLRVQRPFLADTAAFSLDFNKAVLELHRALPDINPALEEGAPVLRRSVTLNDELQKTMVALQDLTEDPRTNLALRALTDTVGTLNPQLRFLGPYVTVCNFWNYFWTYVAEHLSEEDAYGYAQRALFNSNGTQDNGIGSSPAVVPANGENYQPASIIRGSKEFLHAQPYGAAVTGSGAADCEQGQRGYVLGRNTTLKGGRFNIVTSPHTPGAQGPTYKGQPRVPKGETFTREPNVNAVTESGQAKP